MCVCLHVRMPASQFCQTPASPAAIPTSAREASTHTQTYRHTDAHIPMASHKDSSVSGRLGQGVGETSQGANRCRPSGFSVAYVKGRREKKERKMKTSQRMSRLHRSIQYLCVFQCWMFGSVLGDWHVKLVQHSVQVKEAW